LPSSPKIPAPGTPVRLRITDIPEKISDKGTLTLVGEIVYHDDEGAGIQLQPLSLRDTMILGIILEDNAGTMTGTLGGEAGASGEKALHGRGEPDEKSNERGMIQGPSAIEPSMAPRVQAVLEKTDVREPPLVQAKGVVYAVQESKRLADELDWGESSIIPRKDEGRTRDAPGTNLEKPVASHGSPASKAAFDDTTSTEWERADAPTHEANPDTLRPQDTSQHHQEDGEEEKQSAPHPATSKEVNRPSPLLWTEEKRDDEKHVRGKMEKEARTASAAKGPSIRGMLGSQPLEHVLVALERMRAGGILHVTNQETNARLYFQRGMLLEITLDAPVEIPSLGERLIDNRLLKKEDVARGLEHMEHKGLRLGAALIHLHLLETREILRTLRDQYRDRIAHLLTLDEGRFEFEHGAHLDVPPPRPRLAARREVFRIKVERYRLRLIADAEKIEAPYRDHYVYRSPRAPDDLSLVGLDPREKRFVDLCINGQQTLRQVYTVSPLSRRHAHAVVFAMHELGWIAFRREMDARAWMEQEQRKWQEWAARLSGAHLFDVLGVHWTALGAEIEAAHAHLLAECRKDVSKYGPETEKNRAFILKRVEEAYSTLNERSSRSAYRATLIEADQITFMADLLCKQGELALFKEEFREAAEKFARALELVPGLGAAMSRLEELQRHGLG